MLEQKKWLMVAVALGILVLGLPFTGGVTSAAGREVDVSLGFGTRAMGMGGAYVAVVDDATAAYWNPAGITQIKRFAMSPSLTVQSQDWPELWRVIQGGATGSGQTLQLETLVLTQPLGFATSRFGVNFFDEGWGSLQANNDQKNIEYTFTHTSTLTVAVPFWKPSFLGSLAVGGNIKAYQGYYQKGSGSLTGEALWEMSKVEAQSSARGYGVDIGIQGKITPILSFGGVVRDLVSSYQWDGAVSGTRRSPQLQAGLAVTPPFLGLTVAADVEKNLDGAAPARYRLGLEKRFLGIIALRVGGYTNPESQDGKITMTGGLGLGLGAFRLDVAVASADSFRTVTGSAGLSIRF